MVLGKKNGRKPMENPPSSLVDRNSNFNRSISPISVSHRRSEPQETLRRAFFLPVASGNLETKTIWENSRCISHDVPSENK
jgi:hypothetical protein